MCVLCGNYVYLFRIQQNLKAYLPKTSLPAITVLLKEDENKIHRPTGQQTTQQCLLINTMENDDVIILNLIAEEPEDIIEAEPEILMDTSNDSEVPEDPAPDPDEAVIASEHATHHATEMDTATTNRDAIV
jgi:hypothetical protein